MRWPRAIARFICALLAGWGSAACSLDETRPLPEPQREPALHQAFTDGGRYRLRWEALPAAGGDAMAVPKNTPFELRVVVEEGGRPVPDARLDVTAWMDDHGHGMNRVPRVFPSGDGSYRVKGMLLHMAGDWRISIHVEGERTTEVAHFDLALR